MVDPWKLPDCETYVTVCWLDSHKMGEFILYFWFEDQIYIVKMKKKKKVRKYVLLLGKLRFYNKNSITNLYRE